MAFGPGKYDDLATLVRARAKARGVMVLVLHGELGDGFSCQLDVTVDPRRVAVVLRAVADQIERGR